MLIKEYRIVLPLTVAEYRVAQLYMVDKKCREESHARHGAAERQGVEILVNEVGRQRIVDGGAREGERGKRRERLTIDSRQPYTDGPGGAGQYTKKIYHVGSQLPGTMMPVHLRLIPPLLLISPPPHPLHKGWLRSILPKNALVVYEEAWNAYPCQ